MTEHKVERGITVTHVDGTVEELDTCCLWWLGDGVLHTNVRYVAPGAYGWTPARGPSFPVVNIRKWEENR